jgi:hypothetical protein
VKTSACGSATETLPPHAQPKREVQQDHAGFVSSLITLMAVGRTGAAAQAVHMMDNASAFPPAHNPTTAADRLACSVIPGDRNGWGLQLRTVVPRVCGPRQRD